MRHGRGERLVLALLDEWRLDCLVNLERVQVLPLVEWRLDCLVTLVGVRVVAVFLDGQRLDYQVNLVDGRVV